MRQPGQALEPANRQLMERRFRHDFSKVRVHADARAAESAEAVNAVAYTVGSHVAFARARYAPATFAGQWLIAHELAHVAQQERSTPPDFDKLQIGPRQDRMEDDAARVAGEVMRPSADPIGKLPGGDARATLRRLTEAEFRSQLGATPQQRAAIDALFSNVKFAALWDYLRSCTAAPHQDLGPLGLLVTPGLGLSEGVERFGGYDPKFRTLQINPTKPEHKANPTELVDTITHEVIHAEDDLQAACQAAGSGPAPLAGAATATDRFRAPVAGTPAEQHLEQIQGPGASDPCGEFIDINDAAQRMIIDILGSNVQSATVGRPTVTFVNVIIRNDPAAMTFYEACRSSGCALSGAARTHALADCASNTIARFIPPGLRSALLPARIHFDFGSHAVSSDDLATVDMVAIFLAAHPDVSVRLVGHTDPVGDPDFNLHLGQSRANAVQDQLLAKGVAAPQITSVTSVGAGGQLSTGPATHWQDRRVEILP
jgi:outer membrane protein OmpA-like peptidoglycan-associated protein